MIEQDQLERSLDDDAVKRWLEPALTVASPDHTIPEILSNARRQRKRPSLALVAAIVLGMLLLSSLRLPMLAQALASLPLIGDGYERFLQGSGMDIAYQAGFVQELGSQVTEAGVTLTVIAACSDTTQTAVMFSLQPASDGSMTQVWQAISNGELQVTTTPQQIGSYSLQLDQKADAVYGLLKTAPAGWMGRRMDLVVELKSFPSKWQLDFPVMRLNSRLVETVPINQQLTYDGYQITVESLVFAPTQTVLHYNMRGGNLPEGGSATGKVPPADAVSERVLHSNWELKLSDGTVLPVLGGGLSTQGQNSQGEIDFMPTAERSLALWFLGFDRDVGEQLKLTALIDGTLEVGKGSLRLADLQRDAEGTTAVFAWDGPGEILKMGADLIDQQGGLHSGEIVAINGKTETLKYVTLQPGQASPREFQIELYLHDLESKKVFELYK